MLNRPIPRKLLIHEVFYSEYLNEDAWSGKTYKTAVTLKYVRLETVKKNMLNSQGESSQDRAMLIFDCINSSPQASFNKKDRITFRGENYEIREIDILEGTGNKIHHFEIMLV